MSTLLLYSWIAFAIVVAAQRHLRREKVTARAPGTWLGILVQALGFSFGWTFRDRPVLGMAVPPFPDSFALSSVAGAIGLASLGLAVWAIVVLGRNWSVAAQVVDGHRLVTEGPYRIVRHPIYTSMGGLLLATGLQVSNALSLGVGLLVFGIGTLVRVHFEERLLSAHFGRDFAEYAASVPAFIPFLRPMPRR